MSVTGVTASPSLGGFDGSYEGLHSVSRCTGTQAHSKYSVHVHRHTVNIVYMYTGPTCTGMHVYAKVVLQVCRYDGYYDGLSTGRSPPPPH